MSSVSRFARVYKKNKFVVKNLSFVSFATTVVFFLVLDIFPRPTYLCANNFTLLVLINVGTCWWNLSTSLM